MNVGAGRRSNHFSWHEPSDFVSDVKMSELTRILQAIDSGDAKAADELLPLVYGELRKLAAAKMANEAPGQTLQPTALVHEAWLRLAGPDNPKFANRAHFFGAAAEAMRRILIDKARRKHAARMAADASGSIFDGLEIAGERNDQMLAVHEALDELAALYPREAELVKLRYFVGLTNEQAAEVMGVSLRGVKADWAFARAWLFREISRP